uniref:8.9 kDa family member n=1 Tax=Rhipicephalus microplus TaxID=6941 RepID=A0A6M2CYR5_RHIMP
MKELLILISTLISYHVICGTQLDPGSLRVINGTCHFRNTVISDGYTQTSKRPCERWRCYANVSRVVMQGCPPPSFYDPYLTYPGGWPFCCGTNPQ